MVDVCGLGNVLEDGRILFEVLRFLPVRVYSQAYEFVFTSVPIASEQNYVRVAVIPRHQITA